jgi:transposase
VASPRTVLTTRAVAWATSALSYDDTTVSALARHLGVDWHTAWDAIEVEAKARTSNPDRLSGVTILGVDEHIWRPSRNGVDRAVTIMVDLSRDQAGCLHARLLDAVVGRSGSVYKAWLKTQPDGFIDGVEQAALDPFRGYANAIHDGLPDAVAVLDAFHVVRLGTQVVDEVRRRVQQDTLGRRGHKHDPLYKIRGLLRHGVEHLTEKQQAKISAGLNAGDPQDEVNIAWQCYQQLRSIYHAVPAKGPPDRPEGTRQLPHLSDTRGCQTRPHPARMESLIIEKVRRLAHGFKDFDHYRLRIMLAADGRRPYRTPPTHA